MKAYLELDEMPHDCRECILLRDEQGHEIWCTVVGWGKPINGRLPKCPLKQKEE